MMKNGGSKPPPYVDIYNVPSPHGEVATATPFTGCRPLHSLKLSVVGLFYLPLRGKGDRYPLWVVVDEVSSKYFVFLTSFLRKRRRKENDIYK